MPNSKNGLDIVSQLVILRTCFTDGASEINKQMPEKTDGFPQTKRLVSCNMRTDSIEKGGVFAPFFQLCVVKFAKSPKSRAYLHRISKNPPLCIDHLWAIIIFNF